MRHLYGTFDTRKRSFISAFWICMKNFPWQSKWNFQPMNVLHLDFHEKFSWRRNWQLNIHSNINVKLVIIYLRFYFSILFFSVLFSICIFFNMHFFQYVLFSICIIADWTDIFKFLMTTIFQNLSVILRESYIS